MDAITVDPNAGGSCSDASGTPSVSAAAPAKRVTTDADWTQLPALVIMQYMDSKTRAAWRTICKLTRVTVHAATHTLTWQGEDSPRDSLPAALITTLPNLHHLHCSGMKQLTSIQGIPATLRSLDLTDCRSITSIEPLQLCTALEQLKLLCNRSTVMMLPPVMSAISANLHQLDLRIPRWAISVDFRQRDTKVCDVSGSAVTDAVARCLAPLTGLQELSYHMDSNEPAHLQALADTISHMTGLQTLLVSNLDSCIPNALDSQDKVLPLVPAIRQLRQLQSLKLWSNSFQPEAFAALSEAVVYLKPTLTSLDLRAARITPGPIAALVPALQAAALACIKLSSITGDLPHGLPGVVGGNLGSDGMAVLASGLQCCSSLTDLEISFCDIHAAGAADLATALSGCAPTLTSLDISNNHLGADGAARLAPILSRMTSLAKLRYCKNDLGPAGAEALAAALSSVAPSITSLDISENNVGDDGAAALEPALSRMTALAELICSDNGLRSTGAHALASVMSGLTCLRLLDLMDNCLGLEGLKALAQGLKTLPDQQHWDLGRCRVRHVRSVSGLVRGTAALNLFLRDLPSTYSFSIRSLDGGLGLEALDVVITIRPA